jgi:hypothetical protein
MWGIKRASALALAATALGLGLAQTAGAQPTVACTGDPAQPQLLTLDSGAFGYYALPSVTPRGIVVFSHGHSNSAYKWQGLLSQEAQQLGVIAIAMDNRGQLFPQGPTGSSWGWFVEEGAQDGIDAAQLFDMTCQPQVAERLPIVSYGVSMGGNTSGLQVAAGAKRADGSRLFDGWFDVEGVTNVIETYEEAVAVAGPPLNNATGQTAKAEIETEFGGTLQQQPQAYLHGTVVARADDIKASGLGGVVIVHGTDDGTVGSNQSEEMFARLVQEGIPTDFFSVGRHTADQSKGNTLEDTFTLSSRIPGYSSPLTGHGGEQDQSEPVIATGLARLEAWFDGAVPDGFHRYVVDDGTTTPVAR